MSVDREWVEGRVAMVLGMLRRLFCKSSLCVKGKPGVLPRLEYFPDVYC